MNTESNQLVAPVTEIAVAAGEEIMAVYQQGHDPAVTLKADDSPVTAADQRAHAVISQRLQALTPAIPVLSEEATLKDFEVRRHWSRYWLVDPLDGTREFIQRNGDFTVNIALIEAGKPVMGVVHVPVSGTTYSGVVAHGAAKQVGAAPPQAIAVAVMPANGSRVRVVASRNHRGEKLQQVLDKLQEKFADVDDLTIGSSLKICLLAEGKADLYPRLAPTSEWDTAAAHAVLCAAGGDVVDMAFTPLTYNQKAAMLNPYFLAIGDMNYDWRGVLAESLQ